MATCDPYLPCQILWTLDAMCVEVGVNHLRGFTHASALNINSFSTRLERSGARWPALRVDGLLEAVYQRTILSKQGPEAFFELPVAG
jgi:hypothetical protein